MDLESKIFLSHSKHDEDNVRRVRDWLEDLGLNTFVSFDNIRRLNFWSVLTKELRASACLLLIMTKKSLDSDNVQREIHLANKYRKKIFIYQIEYVDEFPDGVDALLTPIQRVEAFKYGHQEGLKRIAEMIFVEAGTDGTEAIQRIESALQSSQAKSLSKKDNHQQNLVKWIDECLDLRWQNGKYHKLSVIDQQILREKAGELGLSLADVRRELAVKRNKREFNIILNSAMMGKNITLKKLLFLETKRISHRISKKEVIESVRRRSRLPAIIHEDSVGMFDSSIRWLTILLDQHKQQLCDSNNQDGAKQNNVVQYDEEDSLNTTVHSPFSASSNHAVFMGREVHNTDINQTLASSNDIPHPSKENIQLTTTNRSYLQNKVSETETDDVKSTVIENSPLFVHKSEDSSDSSTNDSAEMDLILDIENKANSNDPSFGNTLLSTSFSDLCSANVNLVTSSKTSLSQGVFLFRNSSVILTQYRHNRRINKLIVRKIEEEVSRYVVFGRGVRQIRYETYIERTFTHVSISNRGATLHQKGIGNYTRLSYIHGTIDVKVFWDFINSLGLPVDRSDVDGFADATSDSFNSLHLQGERRIAVNPAGRFETLQVRDDFPVAEENRVVEEEYPKNEEIIDIKNETTRSFMCHEGFMLIMEIYLGNPINQLSVERIDFDDSCFTFYGKGLSHSLGKIRSTSPLYQIEVCKDTVYFRQEDFKNLFIAQIDPSSGEYLQLLEFLCSANIPLVITNPLDENGQGIKNFISYANQLACKWSWLGESIRSNALTSRDIIAQQSIQVSILAELASFNLASSLDESFGLLAGFPQVKYGIDLSEIPSVRSAMCAHGLGAVVGLKPFFWYNDSLARRKRGVLVCNRGISLHSFFKAPAFFLFGKHDIRLSENINISDLNDGLEIAIHGRTVMSSKPVQSSCLLSSPSKEQRGVISFGLLRFVSQIDAYAFNCTRLRISLANELRCFVADMSLASGLQWRAYSPLDRHSFLDNCLRELIALAQLPQPHDDDIIFSFTASLNGMESLVLVSLDGVLAVQKIDSSHAKSIFYRWSLLNSFEYCESDDGLQGFQINQCINVFAIKWPLADEFANDFEHIARFVMTLKVRLMPIVRL